MPMAKTDSILLSITPQEIAYFWSQVDIRANDECWRWTGGLFVERGNYGRAYIRREGFRAHRIAFFVHYRIDPQGFEVCHRCDNPPCCNPHHLFKGTQADNMADCKKKGRFPTGDQHWTAIYPEKVSHGPEHGQLIKDNVPRGEKRKLAKLKDADIPEIIRLVKEGAVQHAVAKTYGVTDTVISRICRGIAYTNVPR